MRLTVVGCSGAVPGPASPASCYLIEADDAEGRTWRVVLDLGSGAFGALQRYCDPLEVDAVAVSHLHHDHCADLAALHTYLSYHPDGPGETLVYGPFGTASRIDELRGEGNRTRALTMFAWQAGTPVRVGPMTIHVESVIHPIPAYAMRIEGPSELESRAQAVIAYSGDTDLCAGLKKVASNADVFLCEASFLDSDDAPEGMHITALNAGRVAQQAACDRLIVTHLPPWGDPNATRLEAGTHYRGTLDIARPGMHIVV
ncbi:MBL fold metallo-hydrolase [Demequina oxidasica]|uniref:MBL fold metallo-hydrolase n=1 Tax=Demequina oxidasica TaxID=676199 RepID=UPI00078200C7|nr:MBL fold metallo-hydrolase [Demequina oxidasica]